MNLAGKSSNPIAATKTGAPKRERRHVRTAVTTYVQPHVRATNAMSGELVDLLGQAAQAAAIPARPVTRKTLARRVVPRVVLNTSPLPPPGARGSAALRK